MRIEQKTLKDLAAVISILEVLRAEGKIDTYYLNDGANIVLSTNSDNGNEFHFASENYSLSIYKPQPKEEQYKNPQSLSFDCHKDIRTLYYLVSGIYQQFQNEPEEIWNHKTDLPVMQLES